jgi:hypothetical protein
MANVQNTGFRPATGIGGTQHVVMRFPVDSSNSTAVFIGDIMANNSAGSVRPAAADAGVTAVGVCVGVYDSNGVACGAPGSSSTTKYLASSTAGYADVALALQGAIFVAPFGASYTPTSADIMGSVDHVATAGSTTTGRSGHVLGGAGGINTEAQFRILGLVNEPGNSWGNYADVYVVFLESAWGQVNPSVGV